MPEYGDNIISTYEKIRNILTIIIDDKGLNVDLEVTDIDNVAFRVFVKYRNTPYQYSVMYTYENVQYSRFTMQLYCEQIVNDIINNWTKCLFEKGV